LGEIGCTLRRRCLKLRKVAAIEHEGAQRSLGS
jgi:hypothetical protein